MKHLFVLLIILSTSYTVHAKEINKSVLEKALSNTLQADVRITKIRPTYNPINMFFNALDNNEIKRIKMVINKSHNVTCDLIVYDENQVRLEYCNSMTAEISDGLIYY